MAPDPAIRERALKLLRRGAILPGEAVKLSGMSKQLMNYWIKKDPEISLNRPRDKYLARIWRRLR